MWFRKKQKLQKFISLNFFSVDVAMCVFTLGAKFSYKGTPNDDLPTVNFNLQSN